LHNDLLRLISCVVLLFFFTAWLSAQTATLRGQITDESEALVPAAEVTLTGSDGHAQATKADSSGFYSFSAVLPGKYTVQASAARLTMRQPATIALKPGVQTLNLQLSVASIQEKITVQENPGPSLSTDAESNASALVLRGDDLQALSDDPDDLQEDLQALSGPAAGPNGGQIFIDGFTGGRLPAKQSIREVRINQNPFAAQFDRPGRGRVEVFTKPGKDAFHGQLLFQFSDAAINLRNPFVSVKPPYQRRQWEGEVTGPINKKTSFFMDFERRDINENAFINALTLDQNLTVTPLSQAIVTPLAGTELNFRIDRQLTTDHTLTARYGHNSDANDNQGVGGFSLASRAYRLRDNEDTWQVTETGVLSARAINETRFRYRRQRTRENGSGTAPTLDVLDSFTSGGPPLVLSFSNQDRFELQNFTTFVSGKHTVRWGGLMRGVSLTDQATQNYPGTFTFTSLNAYRTTLLGLQNKWDPSRIRAAGGGASQFSISGGNPLAALNQFDFGVFLQDDWRVRPNFTLSGGLRYETQTHSGDRSDFGPRVGFAWGLGNAAKAPRTVIRGGFGIFYDRLSESLTLDALRLDGIRQQQFLIPFPNFYPSVSSDTKPSSYIAAEIVDPSTGKVVKRVDNEFFSHPGPH
jgi:Carboxypeptidase regulatory-like domain/TonB dependent receptor